MKRITKSGLTEIPEQLKNHPEVKFQSAEGLVNVTYDYTFSCALCGWTPNHHGCIPNLEKHLREEHGRVIEDALWIGALTDREIKGAFADDTNPTPRSGEPLSWGTMVREHRAGRGGEVERWIGGQATSCQWKMWRS